jgi:hypothetical protein
MRRNWDLKTRSNRKASAGLPLAYTTAGVATPSAACNFTRLELLQLFIINMPTVVNSIKLLKLMATQHLMKKYLSILL